MAAEMKLITDINLELTGETKRFEVQAKQGDKGTRFVRASIRNNGQELEIPSGSTVIANIKKPDGKFCFNECTLEGNKVLVQLTNQVLAIVGTAECDIDIRDSVGNLILSSQAFTIEINKSMRNESAIESSDEFTALEKIIAKTEDTMQSANEAAAAANSAKDAANTAAANTNAAIAGANSAKAAAEAAAEACEGIAAGINTIPDLATGKVYTIGIQNGIAYLEEVVE